MRKLLLFSAFLPLVLACGKENNHTIVIPTPSEKAPTSISLSSVSLTPAQAGESFTLTITSPAKPEISTPPEWIGTTLGAYKNYKMQVTVKVAANETYESRTANLTVSASGTSWTPCTTETRLRAGSTAGRTRPAGTTGSPPSRPSRK